MALAANLGFPRLGVNREWKKACEAYWKGKVSADELRDTMQQLRKAHWELQLVAGLDVIPCNDFALYDQMLDTTVMLGLIPRRYNAPSEGEIELDTYFAMARGRQTDGADVIAMEMTKWFDTNYHYIVPEFESEMSPRLASRQIAESMQAARSAGVAQARPVLIGPVTYVLLGKLHDEGVKLERVLDRILTVYTAVFEGLAESGVEWVQIDEPALVTDLDSDSRALYTIAYDKLAQVSTRPKLMLTTYFGGLGSNLKLAQVLHCEGLHVDLVRAPQQLDDVLDGIRDNQTLSLGVVDGRNVWRNDLDASLDLLHKTERAIGSERLIVAPSCSLLHCPIDLDRETALDPEIKEWMAFGKQKLQEVATLTRALNDGEDSVLDELNACRLALHKRSTSKKVTNPDVQKRMKKVTREWGKRGKPFTQRIALQSRLLNLPMLPMTTIGSFPQTTGVRKLRADLKNGKIDAKTYEKELKEATVSTIRYQEEIGLDVLVHGEFERNDMVEYFGEQMDGYVFTQNGWVQSYGTRGVKPPIIFGDVSRPNPMTIDWSRFAQDNTSKPVKGMLTGPITMLQWSFVRDDQPRRDTHMQLALAIRDEVEDLEKAGIKVIQIDEPALREGLPLRRSEWEEFLDRAVFCFRVASSAVKDDTQIHTHMCYSEFNDIIKSIAAMDADVISIEASRSRMELLNSFENFVYPNAIGPGVYDIHSPRVPSADEIEDLIHTALEYIPIERLWINPDCGLKTRDWPEVKAALENMVEATRRVRDEIVTS